MVFTEKDLLKQNEKLLWEGKSSQLINIPFFFVYAMMVLLIFILLTFIRTVLPDQLVTYLNIPLALVIIVAISLVVKDVLTVKFRKYQLSNQRFRTSFGIVNRRIDETELYRVNDSVIIQPFWLRIFDLAHIVLYTSDITDNRELILGIKKANQLKDLIRHNVEIQRHLKSIAELDVKEHRRFPKNPIK